MEYKGFTSKAMTNEERNVHVYTHKTHLIVFSKLPLSKLLQVRALVRALTKLFRRVHI